MTIHICPNCQQRYVMGFGVIDFVHDCSQSNATNAVKQEDVVVVGNWEDYSGIGSKSPQAVMRQGLGDELFGRRAWIEGERKEALTRRGVRKSTHRQRKKLTYIDLKNDRGN